MDKAHLLNAVRYLAFNPVRAKLCAKPREWEWSSVRAHLRGRNDALVEVRPLLAIAQHSTDREIMQCVSCPRDRAVTP